MCDATLLAVPHRAIIGNDDDDDVPPFPMPFENGHEEKNVVGNHLTRGELQDMGVLTKHLDVGVVVQPAYHYIGHITRHVRPGSRPARALVSQTRRSDPSHHHHHPHDHHDHHDHHDPHDPH